MQVQASTTVHRQGAFDIDKKEKMASLDPNRFKIAKNMSVVPGGPMNNNPTNVTSFGPQSSSMSGVNEYPYGDSGMAAPPQMGADSINPMNVPNSGLQQNMPMGRGQNGSAPYGMQQQPAPNGQEPMEGMRLGADAQNRGLTASPFMGVAGNPALMPGALDPTIPGGGSPLGAMPTMQQVVGGEMVPGSTPQKIQKKGKK